MFIGYHIKQNETQAKPMQLATDIKLSQAVLEPGTKNKEPVCLFVEYDKKKFIVAVLDPTKTWQAPLDLMFAAGSEVKFFLRGSGTVHLTGFESCEDLDDMSLSMSSDEDIEESDDDEESELVEPAKKKIKEKQGSAKKVVAKVNGVGKPGQKNGKAPVVGVKGDDSDEDESDDEDFDEDAFEEDDDDDDLDDEDMDELDEDDEDEDESEE